jgi:hypothetical protein
MGNKAHVNENASGDNERLRKEVLHLRQLLAQREQDRSLGAPFCRISLPERRECIWAGLQLTGLLSHGSLCRGSVEHDKQVGLVTLSRHYGA